MAAFTKTEGSIDITQNIDETLAFAALPMEDATKPLILIMVLLAVTAKIFCRYSNE